MITELIFCLYADNQDILVDSFSPLDAFDYPGAVSLSVKERFKGDRFGITKITVASKVKFGSDCSFPGVKG